jgi:hypothetical protein
MLLCARCTVLMLLEPAIDIVCSPGCILCFSCDDHQRAVAPHRANSLCLAVAAPMQTGGNQGIKASRHTCFVSNITTNLTTSCRSCPHQREKVRTHIPVPAPIGASRTGARIYIC